MALKRFHFAAFSHHAGAVQRGEALAMGALCSSERPPVHVCRFPMYVVKVR